MEGWILNELLKKHKKSIIWFFIIGILIMPSLIHLVFKTHTPIDFLVAVWDAGDVLAFYGVLIGSIATVWGVYLSIEYSRSNYQEDVKNRVLPFIALTTLKTKTKFSPFNISDTNNVAHSTGYEEFKLEKIYYVINEGVVTVKPSLTAKQEEKVKQGGWNWETNESGTMQLVCIDLVTMPFEIENVGNGVANQFRMGLNPEKVDEENWKYITPIPLKVGQSLYVHIYCEDGVKSKGNYILDLVYEDIYCNKYRQRYAVIIDNPNDKIHTWFYLNAEQESVKGHVSM